MTTMDETSEIVDQGHLKRLRKKPAASVHKSIPVHQDLTVILIAVFLMLQIIAVFETIIHFPTSNTTHVIFHRSETKFDVHRFHGKDPRKQLKLLEDTEANTVNEETEEEILFEDSKDNSQEGQQEPSDDEQDEEKSIQMIAPQKKWLEGNKDPKLSYEIHNINKVPKAKWPVTIRDEDGSFEDVIHPGDSEIQLAVPRFWSPPVHGNTLMSRSTAMKIGSCTSPDSKSNLQRGDACPIHQRTIFVAIASYRDWQCRYTVESIFHRAKYPDRIRVTVVDQIVDGDYNCADPIVPCREDPNQALCTFGHLLDVYRVDAPLAVGPVFARHLGHRLYRGEYYAMQVDAHVSFTQDWDEDIIQQLESTQNEMAVLSTYLTDVIGSIDEKTGESLRKTRPIMCNTDYEDDGQGMHLRHLSQPESFPRIHGMPQLQPYWAAGFSFSRGHFVVNVPYDWYLPMIFQGEEIAIAVRAFTIGYDFYAPERSVCFHHYAEGENKAKRNTVNHFWENANRFRGKGKLAMMRLLGILYMNPEVDRSSWDHTEEERYGIGHVRDLDKFYSTFGIDVHEKTVVRTLCDFVEPGSMHNKFTKMLRDDRMGIDYGKIDFKLKDGNFWL